MFKFLNSRTSRCWQDMKCLICGQHVAEPLWCFRQCWGIFVGFFPFFLVLCWLSVSSTVVDRNERRGRDVWEVIKMHSAVFTRFYATCLLRLWCSFLTFSLLWNPVDGTVVLWQGEWRLCRSHFATRSLVSALCNFSESLGSQTCLLQPPSLQHITLLLRREFYLSLTPILCLTNSYRPEICIYVSSVTLRNCGGILTKCYFILFQFLNTIALKNNCIIVDVIE